jgi:redox-sensitive bicupin YhaK (pirin superfamily)
VLTTVTDTSDRSAWPGSDILSQQSVQAAGSTRVTDYAFGLLLVHSDAIAEPGEGFAMHQHADVEIFSWVVNGRLRHRDSSRSERLLGSDEAGAITAGRGVHQDLCRG